MAQLIVSQAKRLGRLPLVPPVGAKRMFNNGFLMRIHRRAQIVHLVELLALLRMGRPRFQLPERKKRFLML